MQTIDIAVIEARVREGLSRATEDEVAFIIARCEGRALSRENAELARPFLPRDRERSRREGVEALIGCLLTGQRSGWFSNALNPQVRRIIVEAGARTA